MNRILKAMRNEKGASLLIVIVIFAVVIIMGTVLITISSASYKNSISYHYQKQSYYTARSVMDMVLDNLADTATCAQLSRAIKDSSPNPVTSSGDINGMGSYEVSLVHIPATDKVKVEVKAKYKEKGSVIKATLKKGKGSRLNPLDFALYNRIAGINMLGSSSNRLVIDGNVFSRTSYSPINTELNGKLLTFGAVYIYDPSTVIKNDLIVFGDVALSGGWVDGKLYTTESVPSNIATTRAYVKNGTTTGIVTGIDEGKEGPPLVQGIGFSADVYGRQKVWNPSCIVRTGSSAKVQGFDVDFSSDVITILEGQANLNTNMYYPSMLPAQGPLTGIRTYRDNIKIDYTNHKVYLNDEKCIIDTFLDTVTILSDKNYDSNTIKTVYTVSTNIVSTSIGGSTPINKSFLNVWILPNGKVIDRMAFDVYASTIPSTISRNCKITTSTIWGTALSPKNINIDTTSGDIFIHVPNNLTLENCNISITGDNKVYMLFDDDKELTIKNNCQLGENSLHNELQLYIVGNKLKLHLSGNSKIKGAVYLHEGKYDEPPVLGGGTPTSGINKVRGSIMADAIDIVYGNTYTQLDPRTEPYFNATLPNNYAIYPPLNPDEINWLLERYGD